MHATLSAVCGCEYKNNLQYYDNWLEQQLSGFPQVLKASA